MKLRGGLIILLSSGLTVLGCTLSRGGLSPEDSDSGSPSDLPIASERPSCDGLCIATAPATYTGPSVFWLGLPAEVPDCPPETPYEGIEGFVDGTQVPVLAKECRITPTDSCVKEGMTCAPLPAPDLHFCVHHDGDAACPADYPERAEITEIATHMPVTLCCQKPPLAG